MFTTGLHKMNIQKRGHQVEVYSLGNTDIKLRRNERQFSGPVWVPYVFKPWALFRTHMEGGWMGHIYHWQCQYTLTRFGTCSSHNFIHFIHLHCCSEQNLSPSDVPHSQSPSQLYTVHKTVMEPGRPHHVRFYAGFRMMDLSPAHVVFTSSTVLRIKLRCWPSCHLDCHIAGYISVAARSPWKVAMNNWVLKTNIVIWTQ